MLIEFRAPGKQTTQRYECKSPAAKTRLSVRPSRWAHDPHPEASEDRKQTYVDDLVDAQAGLYRRKRDRRDRTRDNDEGRP